MAWDDLVRVKLEDGSVTSVGRAFAEAHPDDLEVLTDAPATLHGRTIEPEYPEAKATAKKAASSGSDK